MTSELSLHFNYMSSSLPSELGRLSQLVSGLVLSENGFSSTLPTQIGNLESLESHLYVPGPDPEHELVEIITYPDPTIIISTNVTNHYRSPPSTNQPTHPPPTAHDPRSQVHKRNVHQWHASDSDRSASQHSTGSRFQSKRTHRVANPTRTVNQFLRRLLAR